MRTHIRMHIDKKSGDFNEENFISCILEDSEILPATKTPTIEQNNSDLLEGHKENSTALKSDDKDEISKDMADAIIENSK